MGAGPPASGRTRADPAALAALVCGGVACAAAAYVLAVRWSPVGFAYRPPPYGIISIATLKRYPEQKELFHAVAAFVTLIAGGLAAAALALVHPERAPARARRA